MRLGLARTSGFTFGKRGVEVSTIPPRPNLSKASEGSSESLVWTPISGHRARLQPAASSQQDWRKLPPALSLRSPACGAEPPVPEGSFRQDLAA